MENYVEYIGYAVAVLTLIITIYKAHKAGKTYGEIITIIINVLKDENKLVNGKFAPGTFEKIEKIADIISADENNVEEVKKLLGEGKEGDIKIASLNGKSLYLSQLLKINKIRELFKK